MSNPREDIVATHVTVSANSSTLVSTHFPPGTYNGAWTQHHSEAQLAWFFVLLGRLALHPDLIAHGKRTARYAARLGAAVGLSPADQMDLHYAALLHDVGKLTLPDTILHKQGPLSADEYARLQSHPRAGAELMSSITFLHRPSVWISHHHERWDGSGYPYGLRAAFIPLGARILAVADTFDALTSNSLPSRAGDGESAEHLLRLVAGTQLDPDLVSIFLNCTPHHAGRLQTEYR
jgi:HD-GYP domain-containing protein (c-di-GMP phosphodiesterase class II)